MNRFEQVEDVAWGLFPVWYGVGAEAYADGKYLLVLSIRKMKQKAISGPKMARVQVLSLLRYR